MPTGDAPAAVDRLAREALVLADDATPQAVRAAVFNLLRDEEFVPDPGFHEAIFVLAGRGPEVARLLRAEAREAERQRREAEVEAFAAEFFRLPIPERRAGWKRLKQVCAEDERLLARLRGLKPGLSVRTERLHDRSPEVERVAALALEVFVQPSFGRSYECRERVRAVLRGSDLSAKEWVRTAKRLRRRFPRVYRLTPIPSADLIRSIDPQADTPVRRAWRSLTPRGKVIRSIVFTLAGLFWICVLRFGPSAVSWWRAVSLYPKPGGFSRQAVAGHGPSGSRRNPVPRGPVREIP